jgi:hypothetical protein
MGDFDQRRRVAKLKPFADDCAILHAAALAAGVSFAQGAPPPENNSSAVLAAPCSPCFKILRIFRALTGSASSKYSSQSLFTSSRCASMAGPPCIPRRQPCIPRGADPLRRFGHGSLLLAKYRNALPWLTRTKPQLQCTMIEAVEIDVAQIIIE